MKLPENEGLAAAYSTFLRLVEGIWMHMNDLTHKHVSSFLHEYFIMGDKGTTPAKEIYGNPA